MENMEMPMTQGVATPVAPSMPVGGETVAPKTEFSNMNFGNAEIETRENQVFGNNEVSNILEEFDQEKLADVREELSSIINGEEDEVFDNGMPEVFEKQQEEANNEIDEKLNESMEGEQTLVPEVDESETLTLDERVEEFGEVLDQMNENIARLEESSITKEELLAALLIMYELSKKGNEEEKMNLFEILVRLMTKMLIELAGAEEEKQDTRKPVKKKQKDVNIDEIKELLLKRKKNAMPLEKKAA